MAVSRPRSVFCLSLLALALGCRADTEVGRRGSERPPDATAVDPPDATADDPGDATSKPPPARIDALRGHVEVLAEDIGGRGLDRPGTMERAADYIRGQWTAQGYPEVVSQTFMAPDPGGELREVENLAVVVPGRSEALVVIGAHYDTCWGNPGADDNASGVAALLELSRGFVDRDQPPAKTVHFVAFANEEPPYFKDPAVMGSSVYAQALAARGETVAAMLSLESIGYYTDAERSQHYPAIVAPLYPSTGDFVAVVGKNGSRPLIRQVVRALERGGPVPVESIAAPATITGIDWSDHWSFWQQGWPRAVMVTDTATFRNPNYHEPTDTPDTLDYERLAWVTEALAVAIDELADEPP